MNQIENASFIILLDIYVNLMKS